MSVINLNKKRGSILSLVLYITGTIIGVALNFYFLEIGTFKVDSLLIFAFIWTIVLHELTHYMTYTLVAGVDKENLSFSRDKKLDIPYFKIKKSIEKKVLILSLVLPFVTTSMTIVVFNLMTGNFAYCLLLGIGFAMSGADFDIVIQLMNQKQQGWKSLDEEFGFVGSTL